MSEDSARAEARAALDAMGEREDDELDIAEAALAFAVIDAPAQPLAPARAELARLAEEARPYAVCDDAEERALALAGLLVGRHGFTGDSDTYDDPANANLIHVLARRRGLPVALGVVWLHAARAARFDAWGIDFPGHFLIGIAGEAAEGQVVVDVFDNGTMRTVDDLAALARRVEGPGARLSARHLRRMTTREVLLRLQNNLRLRRAAAGDLAGALVAGEDMLRLAPGLTPLWRETAELAERLERPRAALAAWERAAALGDPAAPAAVLRLRSRLN
ncbi:MAG: transglutaminase-like domain-containing protein [Acetobacteraceae bacterium]|jgi:regulator of sirC expression with transglutaminase-like and TPR domain|nr:transglutaminase-like domain-containing protein [Acetobacteraceae bacterium]